MVNEHQTEASLEVIIVIAEAVAEKWKASYEADPELLGRNIWKAQHAYMKCAVESMVADIAGVDPGVSAPADGGTPSLAFEASDVGV